ncbi:MAG: hypothetical protein JWR69_2081 [Pedosphaera sp.]|nr:hypothetical protein [Pedosphaera sp.]
MREKQTENATVESCPSVQKLEIEWLVEEATSVRIRDTTQVVPPPWGSPERPDRWPYLRFSDSSLTA